MVAATLLGVLLAGCAAPFGPAVTFDTDTDFGRYQTYSWAVTGALQDLDPASVDAVRTRVERELAAKGFQPAASEADFIVSLTASQLAYARLVPPRYSSRPTVAFRDSPLAGAEESVVTIAVSITDGTTRRALWRGSLSRALGGQPPGVVAAELVPEILRAFPPET